MDEEYEEYEELTDRRKKDILEKMSKEDLLTCAYAIAEKTYESKQCFRRKQLEEKENYGTCQMRKKIHIFYMQKNLY